MKTTITIKNLQKKLYPNAKRIKQAVLKALSQLDFKKSIELSICFVTDAKIRRLNLRYRGSDEPTDVLTFDNSIDRGRLLADIVVSTDTAIR
ncbi:MAG TPA: rRNA maturation RNase YbeY, partial [Candidatus Omnitrophota bacterium]|nr:rRNA maturation RNase YbeY [Candidatus Omnitrophota bacterium]